jgi:hypothetical protein
VLVFVLVLDLDRCRSNGGVNGVQLVRQDGAKSPGSDGASPYLPQSFSILIVADQSAGSTGFESYGRMAPKASVRRSLALPSAIVLVLVLVLVLDLSSLAIKGGQGGSRGVKGGHVVRQVNAKTPVFGRSLTLRYPFRL